MDVREKLVELLSEKCMETCKQRKGYVCSVEECKRSKEKCCGFYADHLIANGVTVQEHGYWETVVEVMDNTVRRNGVKVEYKRCSCCKNPPTFLENDFCCNCGAKLDLPEPPKGE